jgi:hypothetical protein
VCKAVPGIRELQMKRKKERKKKLITRINSGAKETSKYKARLPMADLRQIVPVRPPALQPGKV